LYHGPSKIGIALYIVLGTLAGLSIGFMIAMRYNKSFNKKVRESVWIKSNPIVIQNPFLRKSLSLGALDIGDLSDISEEYGEASSERTKLIN
jgi:hypothetical protein